MTAVNRKTEGNKRKGKRVPDLTCQSVTLSVLLDGKHYTLMLGFKRGWESDSGQSNF